MARLSISAPPGGIVIVIPMIYNLLKRFPACMVLIHREKLIGGLYESEFYAHSL